MNRIGVYILSSLLLFGCNKQSQSIQESISCYTDYESITIELKNMANGETTVLEPSDAGQVDFGELQEGSYELYIETYASGVDYPTIEYTRRFDIPKNNGEPLLALPEPLKVEDVDYTVEDDKSFAYITFMSSDCRSILEGSIYVSSSLPVLIEEGNKIYDGIFTQSYNARIAIEDTVVYAVYESKDAMNDRSFVTRTLPIRLEKFGSSESNLQLGEKRQFTILKGETKYFTLAVEKGKYYMVEPYDHANSELSGEVLVLSSEPNFYGIRTEDPKGASAPFRSLKDGYITISADIAFEGSEGEFAILVSEIDINQAQPWSPTYVFTETNSYQFSKRTLPAGTYTLNSELLGGSSGMAIYYSLFSNSDGDLYSEVIAHIYLISPGFTGSNPISGVFTIDEEQEVVLFMNSAFYGTENSIKIDLIE